MCDFMICGTSTKKCVTSTSTQRIYCPYCMCMAYTVRMTERTFCTFFFIPIIKCSETDEYTGCSECNCKLGVGNLRSCIDCHNVIFSGYDFCGRCGKRAELANNQRMTHSETHQENNNHDTRNTASENDTGNTQQRSSSGGNVDMNEKSKIDQESK